MAVKTWFDIVSNVATILVAQLMRTGPPCGEIAQGREVLKRLLGREEGYPCEFRKWLKKMNIINADLLPNEH